MSPDRRPQSITTDTPPLSPQEIAPIAQDLIQDAIIKLKQSPTFLQALKEQIPSEPNESDQEVFDRYFALSEGESESSRPLRTRLLREPIRYTEGVTDREVKYNAQNKDRCSLHLKVNDPDRQLRESVWLYTESTRKNDQQWGHMSYISTDQHGEVQDEYSDIHLSEVSIRRFLNEL